MLKKILSIVLITIFCSIAMQTIYAQGIGINETGAAPDSSAILDASSSDKGFLPPRLTTSERDLIVEPANGLIIFNTTTGCPNYFNNLKWYELCGEEDFTCGEDSVVFNYNNQTVSYGTVIGQNNSCWLDRNLGASRKSQSKDDYLSYGDLFQWGRLDDEHQIMNWSSTNNGTPLVSVTNTLSIYDAPLNNLFITTTSGNVDWRNPQNNSLWQGSSGINNPCPTGWRIPTIQELNNEMNSWNSLDSDGAYDSDLKLPSAGVRRNIDGNLNPTLTGNSGYFWSSSVDGNQSFRLGFSINDATTSGSSNRAIGLSVRCIKD